MLLHIKKTNLPLSKQALHPATLLLLLSLLLAACGSPEPTPTPIPPAPTNTPAPTDLPAPAEPTAAAAPESPLAEPAAQPASPLDAPAENTPEAAAQVGPTTTIDLGLAAFVRDGILYLQSGTTGTELIPVEDCSAGNCFIYHLRWSPTDNSLLYYVGSYDGSVPHQIRLADATGTSQTVTEQPAYVQPAGWSPDGTAIVYRTDTDRHAETTDGPGQRIQEVWTMAVNDDGTLAEPALQGEVGFYEGCGGGGRSESANVYEREGGFAYGYLAGITLWTPDDILLYSDNCGTRGVSRFDLANDQVLEPYDGGLRSLSLNGAGDGWVAINTDNQLIMGTPTTTETTVISTSAAPEMVFFGKMTGTIYYTTLEVTGGVDLVEQASAWLDQSIAIYPYFDITIPRLIALDPATGEETELYSGDGYAYARVKELADGGVIFSRVQDNRQLQVAVENEELTADNWRDYLPTADLLLVTPDGAPSVLLTDVEQYTPAQ